MNTINLQQNSQENSEENLQQKIKTNDDLHFLLSDHPEYETGRKHYLELHKNDENIHTKAIFGFIIYFVVFIIIVPMFLKNLHNEEIFLSYLANVDLLATVLSFKNGPFNLGIFRYLYIDSRPLIGYINQNLINYVVLLAVAYIVITTSVKSKNVGDGMAKMSIILLVTYLFPGRVVSSGMHFIDKKLTGDFKINPSISWNITFVCGLLIAVFFIATEAFAIKMFYKSLSKFYEKKVFKYLDLE